MLCRLYECFVLDHRWGYRNFLEHFWRQAQWPVRNIPDPADDDPERYAFLAGTTYLMVRAFNRSVGIGLDRDSPAIQSPDETERARNRPESEKIPKLDLPLIIPMEDGTAITDEKDKRLDPDLLSKNISYGRHIYTSPSQRWQRIPKYRLKYTSNKVSTHSFIGL